MKRHARPLRGFTVTVLRSRFQGERVIVSPVAGTETVSRSSSGSRETLVLSRLVVTVAMTHLLPLERELTSRRPDSSQRELLPEQPTGGLKSRARPTRCRHTRSRAGLRSPGPGRTAPVAPPVSRLPVQTAVRGPGDWTHSGGSFPTLPPTASSGNVLSINRGEAVLLSVGHTCRELRAGVCGMSRRLRQEERAKPVGHRGRTAAAPAREGRGRLAAPGIGGVCPSLPCLHPNLLTIRWCSCLTRKALGCLPRDVPSPTSLWPPVHLSFPSGPGGPPTLSR